MSFLEKKKIIVWDAELVNDGEIYCAVPGQVVGLENEIKKLNSTSPEKIISHASKILTEKGYTLRDDITALGIRINS